MVSSGNEPGLTVFPLVPRDPANRDRAETDHYTALSSALREARIAISEVSESGAVPNLQVENTGMFPVLMIVSEKLVGAKQNRILNSSIMVIA